MVATIKKLGSRKAVGKAKVFLTGNYRIKGSVREVEIRSVESADKCFVTLDLLEAYSLVASERAPVVQFNQRKRENA